MPRPNKPHPGIRPIWKDCLIGCFIGFLIGGLAHFGKQAKYLRSENEALRTTIEELTNHDSSDSVVQAE